jgi:hypothetical protein
MLIIAVLFLKCSAPIKFLSGNTFDIDTRQTVCGIHQSIGCLLADFTHLSLNTARLLLRLVLLASFQQRRICCCRPSSSPNPPRATPNTIKTLPVFLLAVIQKIRGRLSFVLDLSQYILAVSFCFKGLNNFLWKI